MYVLYVCMYVYEDNLTMTYATMYVCMYVCMWVCICIQVVWGACEDDHGRPLAHRQGDCQGAGAGQQNPRRQRLAAPRSR